MKSASPTRLLNEDVLVRGFAIFAAIGFTASAAIHLASFFGISLRDWPQVEPVLHVGVFAALLLAASRSGKSSAEPKEKGMERLFAAIPKWLKTAVVIVGVYAFVNALIFMFFLSEGGAPREVDGKLVLQSHGTTIRELTPEEFSRHQAYQVRGPSGHWMAFYAISFAMLTGASRVRANPDDKGSASEVEGSAYSAPPQRTASSSASENDRN